jgi:hypothetical protein
MGGRILFNGRSTVPFRPVSHGVRWLKPELNDYFVIAYEIRLDIDPLFI